jgi:2-alkyl-3-oxoalkanoate reductase
VIPIAVIGAGGYVGGRVVEMATLGAQGLEGVRIVPVVRRPRALARLARLGPLETRFGDLASPASISDAVKGCKVAVNLTMGDHRRFVADVANLYEACRANGVECLIHLSSAEVYGRCDQAGLTDDSPWFRGHWMGYAREKGRAEDWLRERSGRGGPKIVVLRPGLVWGPRSGWVAGPAQQLVNGSAGWVDGGKWACNLCFVDSLARMIAAVARRPVPGFYNVGDGNRPAWRRYLGDLSKVIGTPPEDIHDKPESDCRTSWGDRFEVVREAAWFKSLKARFRNQTKAKVKRMLLGAPKPPEGRPAPSYNREQWWLQTTRYALPTGKFRDAYPEASVPDYDAVFPMTASWLQFAGYARG